MRTFSLILMVIAALLLVGCSSFTYTSFNQKLTVSLKIDGIAYIASGVSRLTVGSMPTPVFTGELDGESTYESFAIGDLQEHNVFISWPRSSETYLNLFGQKKSESNRAFLRRVKKTKDVFRIEQMLHLPQLICFDENWSVGSAYYGRLELEQDVCGMSIEVTSVDYQVTDEPVILGRTQKIIGEDRLISLRKLTKDYNYSSFSRTNLQRALGALHIKESKFNPDMRF